LLPFEKIKSEKMNRATATSSPFSLSKWYLDCVDTRGNVFIGYSAVLKWKKIRLNYANILDYNSDRGLQTGSPNRYFAAKTSFSPLQPSSFNQVVSFPVENIRAVGRY
jgi:hypothetical protein